MSQDSRRCGGLRKDGRPCRAWAVRGSDPPRCPGHLGPEQSRPQEGDSDEGGRVIEEAADGLRKNADETLTNELRSTREVVRGILEQLSHELDPAEYAQLIELFYKGNTSIVDILRAQQALSGKAKGGLPPEFEEAIEKANRKLRAEP